MNAKEARELSKSNSEKGKGYEVAVDKIRAAAEAGKTEVLMDYSLLYDSARDTLLSDGYKVEPSENMTYWKITW